ncbi:hypothetical protein GCM10027592_57890 [Spirosoma flavus]
MQKFESTSFEEEVYRKDDLVLTVSDVADPAAVDLLKRTIYGTKGVRYQHTNQATKIHDLLNPRFFQLRQAGQLVGIYCLDERLLDLGTQQVTGFYGRYLAVEESHSGKGYGRPIISQFDIRNTLY